MIPPRDPAPEERSLDRPLADLSRRKPVTCSANDTVRHALETLRDQNVGSIVIVDPQDKPLGIVTLGDVLTRVALPAIDLETPVAGIMTPAPVGLPAQAPAFRAALLMARENIRHVPLLEQERLVGMVSESRLFSVWRRGIGSIRACLLSAQTVDDAVIAAQGIASLPGALLSEGLGAHAIGAMMTSLNDLLTERLLDITGCGAMLAKHQASWLALGSQGRGEQTLASDQDNAIVFADVDDPASVQAELLPYARRVNEALDRCGFELCRGNIMAGNPDCCQSLSQWKQKFSSWMDRPDRHALLNASIFFDFRPVCGPHPMATSLRAWLTDRARHADRFLTLMALNAMNNEPPLGLVRDFVLSRKGDHVHTLDLKTNGIQIFVESARVMALANGSPATHTIERLEECASQSGVPESDLTAWRDAFFAIQRLRLTLNVQQIHDHLTTDNHLDPDHLNTIDRNLLKDSLKHARQLQGKLSRDFSLNNIRE
jgi:CBS domain-containing protein